MERALRRQRHARKLAVVDDQNRIHPLSLPADQAVSIPFDATTQACDGSIRQAAFMRIFSGTIPSRRRY
jgi:hypothetical protein